jgi:hypothetical protein
LVGDKLIKNRECTRCKQAKSIFDFKKDKRREAGRSSWCKTCHTGQSKEYRARVPYLDRRDLDKEIDKMRGGEKSNLKKWLPRLYPVK